MILLFIEKMSYRNASFEMLQKIQRKMHNNHHKIEFFGCCWQKEHKTIEIFAWNLIVKLTNGTVKCTMNDSIVCSKMAYRNASFEMLHKSNTKSTPKFHKIEFSHQFFGWSVGKKRKKLKFSLHTLINKNCLLTLPLFANAPAKNRKNESKFQ